MLVCGLWGRIAGAAASVETGSGEGTSRNSASAGAQTMSGARRRGSRGARISTPFVVQARISLLGANTGSSRISSLWPWARYRPVRGDSVYVADGGKGNKMRQCDENLAARGQPE
jgi:hypothetical protein